ncbi:hypothetical protein L2E82_17915 [Cichorium intybus]|uniref:Uncharacterized protein n=4 Tax=Cichorium intybus TaxID=13427 RepID=A0ACB9D0E8_CICIN|nr:hypothetical protein L2E82_30511 [Cichorium intybus]KAI3740097.1 hypothetical protein L2E82_30515 [Cichorium intybus]KAI3740100.1 hypothetical protein L2E82_30518 [Cichorium intybus]KAI3767627.1 hypothetical protein L2E82_17915 [Cichorium intybus]
MNDGMLTDSSSKEDEDDGEDGESALNGEREAHEVHEPIYMADEGGTLTDLHTPKIKLTKVIQSPTGTKRISNNTEGGETSSKGDEYMQNTVETSSKGDEYMQNTVETSSKGDEYMLNVSNLMNEYGDDDHEATTVMNSDGQGNAAADREWGDNAL